jgi:hypothetical protein
MPEGKRGAGDGRPPSPPGDRGDNVQPLPEGADRLILRARRSRPNTKRNPPPDPGPPAVGGQDTTEYAINLSQDIERSRNGRQNGDPQPARPASRETRTRDATRPLPGGSQSRVTLAKDTEHRTDRPDRAKALANLARRPRGRARSTPPKGPTFRRARRNEPATQAGHERWVPIHAGRRGLALAAVTAFAVIVTAAVILNNSPTRPQPQPHRITGTPLASTDTSLAAYPPGIAATVDHAIATIAKHHITAHRRHPHAGAHHKPQRRHPRPVHHSSSPLPQAPAPSRPAASTGGTSTSSTSASSESTGSTSAGASHSSAASSSGGSTAATSSSQTGSASAPTSHSQTAGPTGPASILGPGTCNC